MTEKNAILQHKIIMDRIAIQKKVLKINYEELAEITGINKKQLNQYIKGHIIPSSVKLIQMLDAVGLKIDTPHQEDKEA